MEEQIVYSIFIVATVRKGAKAARGLEIHLRERTLPTLPMKPPA